MQSAHNIQISMDGKGRSIDNIVIERFWRSLKYEEIYLNDYKSMGELRYSIDNYINRLLLKPFSIFGYMSLRSYFNLKYKSNFNITKI